MSKTWRPFIAQQKKSVYYRCDQGCVYMQDVIIVGASGFGREVLSLIESINGIKPIWNVLGFIDDNLSALDGFDLEFKVLGRVSDWIPTSKEQYVLAIAAPRSKEKVVSVLKNKGAQFATIIAPSAEIGERTRIGEGVVMFGSVGISVDVQIGNFVFFNALGGIGHDVIIGDYCTFGPKVCISGKTRIGKCVNVGALASTFPGVIVGDYATIGMNSAVIRRVGNDATVIGVPAKTV